MHRFGEGERRRHGRRRRAWRWCRRRQHHGRQQRHEERAGRKLRDLARLGGDDERRVLVRHLTIAVDVGAPQLVRREDVRLAGFNRRDVLQD